MDLSKSMKRVVQDPNSHSSCSDRVQGRWACHSQKDDIDKLDKTQERATYQKKKKMMKRLEGLNDEERLKELNMDRLAKCRLKATIRTVGGYLSTSRQEGRTSRCGVR
jgi:hypothetical protein